LPLELDDQTFGGPLADPGMRDRSLMSLDLHRRAEVSSPAWKKER
jgi:hypothetical protein